MKKIIFAILFTLPSIAFASNFDYITVKGGLSKSNNTGETLYSSYTAYDNDIETAKIFGLGAGKYIANNFRLEIEAVKRWDYKHDTVLIGSPQFTHKGNIETRSLFVNGFYDFQDFSLGSKSFKPYIGAGIGFSRNKLGKTQEYSNGTANSLRIHGKVTSEFVYKLSAGVLLSLSENLSLDVNCQYVDLGDYESTRTLHAGGSRTEMVPISGGKITAQELTFGLQYTF